jgi:hypothetical protein
MKESTRAILVIGHEEPRETALERLERYEEVFVVARAVDDPGDQWVVDEARNRASARRRLQGTIDRLRAHGVQARGAVGDAGAAAARADALAMFAPDGNATFA